MECRFDLDTRCNYRCIYCPNFDDPQRNHASFPLQHLEKAFSCLGKLGWSIYLSCAGEPLVYPHFGEAIETANRIFKNKDVALVSNGFLLNEINRKVILNSCITRLFVSIDTISPLLYRRLCGTGGDTLSVVQNNVKEIIRERGKSRYPKVIIIAIAMKSTLPEFMELAKWSAETGVDGVRVHWLLTSNPELMETEIPLKSEVYPVLEEMNRYLLSRGVHLDYPFGSTKQKLVSVLAGRRLVKIKTGYFIDYFKKYYKSRKNAGCRALGSIVDVDGEGNVYCCPGKIAVAGNILTDSAADIKKKIRDFEQQQKINPLQNCTGCNMLKEFE